MDRIAKFNWPDRRNHVCCTTIEGVIYYEEIPNNFYVFAYYIARSSQQKYSTKQEFTISLHFVRRSLIFSPCTYFWAIGDMQWPLHAPSKWHVDTMQQNFGFTLYCLILLSMLYCLILLTSLIVIFIFWLYFIIS